MGVRGREARYAIAVVAANKFKIVMWLEDLELQTVYEWSARSNRNTLVFDILKDGEVVRTERIPGNNTTVFGFFATIRYIGDDSDICVALD